jgi:antitoxin ParD1/3/4
MTKLTISLPDPLKAFVDEQVKRGNSRSVNEYISSVLTAAQKQQAEEKLISLVEEADDSGQASPWTAKKMETIRREGMKLLALEKRKNAKNRSKPRSRS